jgi:hypothetical protein
MAHKYKQGFFKPINPEKYKGDADNIFSRSSWEFLCMSSLDRDPNIISWSSEELIVPYFDPVKGKMRRYFPDFMIQTRNVKGQTEIRMIEVKPLSQSIKPTRGKKRDKTFMNEAMTYVTNNAKWTAARAFCAQRGWIFQIVTEKDLGL